MFSIVIYIFGDTYTGSCKIKSAFVIFAERGIDLLLPRLLQAIGDLDCFRELSGQLPGSFLDSGELPGEFAESFLDSLLESVLTAS